MILLLRTPLLLAALFLTVSLLTLFQGSPHAWAQKIEPTVLSFSRQDFDSGILAKREGSERYGDKVEQTDEGTVIKQTSGGKSAEPAAVIFAQPAKGPFTLAVALDLLAHPKPRTRGPGTGFAVRIVPASEGASPVTIAHLALPQGGKVMAWFRGDPASPQQQGQRGIEFSGGTWFLQREPDKIRVSVSDATFVGNALPSPRESIEIPFGTFEVSRVEFIVLKNDNSKPSCDVLLKQLFYLGDEFLSQPPPRKPFLTLGLLWSLLFWSSLLFLAGYGLYFLAKFVQRSLLA